MADHVNHHFKRSISEKDIEENILILQPLPENASGVKKLDHFVKSIMGQSARAKTQPWKNFKQKTLDVMGPFIRCKKGWRISKMPQMILCESLLKTTSS